MTARDCVIVVKRDDGIWDASCFDERCGFGLHGLGEDGGDFPNETAARRAATEHRAELKQLANAEKRCPTCDQRIPQEVPS